MADVQIGEVQTEIEITQDMEGLSPAHAKKIVAMVMEHLRAQQEHQERRESDDTVTDHAYAPGND
jgi:hypothetical protein